MFKLTVAAIGLISLAACSSSSGGGGGGSAPPDYTNSGFIRPTSGASAQIPVSLGNEQNGNIYNPLFGGAAYVTGTDGAGAKAYAGIIPGTNPGAPVTNGTVRYNTKYQVAAIENISVSGGFLRGVNTRDSGSLTLVANFNGNTLTGTDGTFAVDGRMSGQNLSGRVSYGGVNGSLTGLIGDDAVVGAFNGNNSTMVYSGGFIGTN